jgi:signal transduction histidine kinase
VRRVVVALAVGGLSVGVGWYTLRVVARDPAYSLAGTSILGRAALAGVGLALVAAGLGSWLQRPGARFGSLLTAAGFGWFAVEWSNPSAGSALVFTAGLVLFASCPPLFGHAALSYRGGLLGTRVAVAVVAAGYVVNLIVLGLLPALFYDPRAECGDCPRNLLLVESRPAAVERLQHAGLWLGAGTALGLAALLVAGLVGFSAAARRVGLPVLAAATTYALLVTALDVAWTDRGPLWSGTPERRLWLGQAVALVAVVVGVVWGWGRARRGRAAVARITLELAHSPPTGGLRDALAEIVGDPQLALAFPLEGSGRLVDGEGRDVVLPAGQQQTTLTGGGRPIAVLSHAPHLLDDEQLLGEVAASAGLALENEGLQAGARARLDQLRRSRARIVEEGDAERRRLERDLHDGAQQRLVGLSLSLRLLRSRLGAGVEPAVSERLAAAEADLREAIDSLRDLAHGIFPAVLEDGGLGPALGALAEDACVPIRLDGVSGGRYPAAVESAAYLVVAETATAARQGLIVHADRSHDILVVEVEARELDDRLDRAELADRVAAADGFLCFERSDGGVRIRAEFPCAS